MKYLLLGVLCLTLGGCSTNLFDDLPERPQKPIKGSSEYQLKSVVYDEVIIDGCEYLTFKSYGPNNGLAHKGDCKQCRKWMKENLNGQSKRTG
jgi:hypothetical protein